MIFILKKIICLINVLYVKKNNQILIMNVKKSYTSGCKLENMIDIKHPKCIVCKITTPVFNLPGEKTATFIKERWM